MMRPGRAWKFYERGASIIEAVIALPILLVVILGAIQFGLVYEAKATLNHASLQAARLGAVRHADLEAMRRGLARGLMPLYSPDSSLSGVARSITQINASLASDARIRIINPTREAFDDFGVDVDGEREIPNDRLHVRSTATGAQSGINIQDANLLKVQITYGYELHVPLVNWFISRVLLGVRRGADSFEQQLLRRTRIPIIATATVRMQSAARLNDAVVSLNDLPDLDRIPSDAGPPSTDTEPTEQPEPTEAGEQTPPGEDEDDDEGSALDEGFFGFGGGPADGSGAGANSDGDWSGSGSSGGPNAGNPQSCPAVGTPSPFPGDTGPPGNASPVDPGPGFPGVFAPTQATGASLDSISLASLSVGNPIHVVTGNKYQVETDIAALPGALGLGIHRHYNSAAVSDRGILGAGWRLSYDARLRARATGVIEIVQADGRLLVFSARADSTRYVSQRASDGVVTASDQGFRWLWPSGRVLQFDVAGRLLRMDDHGAFTHLHYNETGELISVRDSQRRELRFEYYANGRLATIRGPAKLGVRYVYDQSGNLEQAIGTDGVARRYYYEDARHPHHLTGIAVGSVRPLAYGKRAELARIATWSYDEKGRAVFSSHPEDAGKVTLKFAAGHTDVTDAFGRVTRYLTDTRAGIAFVSEVRGPGCGKCGQGDALYTYDDRFEPVEITTKSGGMLRFRRDEAGRVARLERVIAGEVSLLARYVYEGSSARPARIERPSVRPNEIVTLSVGYTNQGLLQTLREDGFTPTDEAYEPIGRTTALTYDSSARIARIDGPRTDVDDWTDISYDSLGRVSAITSPAGEKRIVAYDALGRATRIEEPGRPVLELAYDSRGRITSITQLRSRGRRSVQYRYDIAGRLEEVVDSNGRRQRYGFDTAGRPNRLASSDTDVVVGMRYAADDSIERIGVVGSNGQLLRTLYYTYDAERRLTEVRDGDGQPLQRFAYLDGDALPDRKTDPLGHESWLAYDPIGQLTSVLAPDGGFTRLERNSTGMLTSIQAPNDARTTFVYDDFGRRVEEHSTDRGTTRYRYDPAGNLIAKRDARGFTTRLEYDAANRLVRVERKEGTSTLSYSNGLLAAVKGENDERFVYDRDAQLTAHTRVMGGRVFTTRFAYDAVGRLETRDLPSGARLRYRYNAGGHLQSITQERWYGDVLLVQAAHDPDSKEFLARLHAHGNFVFGNDIGTRSTFGANSDNLRRRTIDGVATLEYEYDEAGRMTQVRRDKSARRFGYDSVGRLTAAKTSLADSAYAYDRNGNRIESLVRSHGSMRAGSLDVRAESSTAAFSTPSPAEPGTVEVGAKLSYAENTNRLVGITDSALTTYRYDAAGNPVQIGSRRYEYDSSGRATKLFEGDRLVAEYRYNFWGERVQKIVYSSGDPVVSSFIYEHQQLIAEVDSRGRITREYVYLDHHPIAVIDRGVASWIHTDHLGTPIAMTSRDRTIVWRADHEPFGAATIDPDPDGDKKRTTLNLRFPGQYADAESGTHYNYFRDYDPQTGRYLTSDPIGFRGGSNPFAYVHNSPLGRFDSLGLYDEMVHYYMTYFLGLVAGLPQDVARTMAIAAQYIDENPQTRPTSGPFGIAGANDPAIPLYHFVLDYDAHQFGDASDDSLTRFYNPSSGQLGRLFASTNEGRLNELWNQSQSNGVATQCVANNGANSARYQLFGEYLHSYQDTFAHRDMFNMSYGPDTNPRNRPIADEGHFGLHGPLDYMQPDRTFNQDYDDDESECVIGTTVRDRHVRFGLTESQCRNANGVYTPSERNAWAYNELRTLRMEYEVFRSITENFGAEIAGNRDHMPRTFTWADIAGSPNWNSSEPLANSRIGLGQTFEEWARGHGHDRQANVGSVHNLSLVLQQYNASRGSEEHRLAILNDWLRLSAMRDENGRALRIESWDAQQRRGAVNRGSNLEWIPDGTFDGVMLPTDH